MAAVEDGEIEMIACPRLLDEVRRGLEGRYFSQRLSEEERQHIETGLARVAAMYEDPESPPPLLRDPDDDYLVALARTAGVEAIVTGDRDLLDHDGLEPPALGVHEACERFNLG